MTDEAVAFRYWKIGNLARQVVEHLIRHLMREGLHASEIAIKAPDEARYRLEKNPDNGEYSLMGDWFDEQGRKLGCLVFHPDGSFFVEHEVVKPHPRLSQCSIAAVSAWGKRGELNAESRLQPLAERTLPDSQWRFDCQINTARQFGDNQTVFLSPVTTIEP